MLKRFGVLSFTTGLIIAMAIFAPSFSWQIGATPKADVLNVKARDLSLVCPGPLYKAGGAAGNTLGDFAPVGTAGYVSEFNPSHGATLTNDNGVFNVHDSTTLETQGSQLLNAAQLQLSAGATLNGLAGTNCYAPTNEIWLLGGDTTTGRESLLILRNPTGVDSTVNLQIFTEAGSIDAPGLNGIAVVAGKTTVVPLAGIVPNTASFTTRVTASGGAVAAWIQQRTVRGLSAAGVDYVSSSPDAETKQIIPGIFVRGSKLSEKIIASNSNFSDLRNVIRVFVPGDKDATVTAQVVGTSAGEFGTVIHQVVKAGTTADLEIASLKDGNYVAIIDSDVKIRAAARLSRVTATSAPDFTWIPAAEGFTGKRNISIPNSGITKICIFDSATNIATVSELTPGSTYRFAGSSSPIFATVVIDINGTLTNFSVLDQKNAGGEVSVNVR
ncbi:MAG: DUF5719 family protein [Rhodoluna sp.]